MKTPASFTLLLLLSCSDDTDPPPVTDFDPHAVCPEGKLTVTVNAIERQPTVPLVKTSVPTGVQTMTVTYNFDTHSHRFEVPDPEAGYLSFARPMEPLEQGTVTVDLTYDGGTCTGSTEFTNGSLPGGVAAALNSTRFDESSLAPQDYFLLPGSFYWDAERVVLINGNGQVIWSLPVYEESPSDSGYMRTAHLSKDGEGVWVYQQGDGLEGLPTALTSLTKYGWTGEALTTLKVPHGHHDWALSRDEETFYTLGLETMKDLTALCKAEVFGDVLASVDLFGDDDTLLYSTVNDGYPIIDFCADLISGDHYSYFNGFDVVDDTIAISTYGAFDSVLIGHKDGDWSLLNSASKYSDLTVTGGDGLFAHPIDAPHSALCTEGVDWFSDDSLNDATTCLVFNRRGFSGSGKCDTIDIFTVDEARTTAEYLATFPPVGTDIDLFSGCSYTESHGSATLIGPPNPNGDGHSRVVMFAANEGVLSIVDISDQGGEVQSSLDYVIYPSVPAQLHGWFIEAYTTLGDYHTLETSPQ